MSEHVRTNRDRAATHPPHAASFETADGAGRRIDTAHHDPAVGPASPVDTQSTGRFTRDEQLLLQASQIAEHLRSQYEDLNRREQTANTHLAWIDQERRTVRFWVQQFQDEARQRETSLETLRQQLEQRDQTQRDHAAEIDLRQAELDHDRDQLNAERARLREELQRELDADRATLEHIRDELLEERSRLQQQIEQNEQQHAAALERIDRELEQAHRSLQTEIEEEYTQQRDALSRDREAWQTERAVAEARLAQARESQEEAGRQAQQELEQQRREQQQRLEQEEAEHQRRLAEERRDAENDLVRLRSLWDAQKQSELAASVQEKALQENRLRLQQDHLGKTRRELEVAQLQHRLEVQQWRERFENDETLLRLRLAQLDHYRALLEERELSIQREREMLAQTASSLQSALKRDRKRLESDREAWEHERQAQRAEIRRQQDVLALHAQNLESRRVRLDHLRGELEETHRNTLEMRMAVEDVWAQIAQTTGDEAAAESVTAAKAALAEHYRHLEEGWRVQQHELEESHRHLQEQKDELDAERRQFTEWLAERDERLRLREENLQLDSLSIEQRETTCTAARQQWMHEKVEAETVIRELLRQLTELNHPD